VAAAGRVLARRRPAGGAAEHQFRLKDVVVGGATRKCACLGVRPTRNNCRADSLGSDSRTVRMPNLGR